MYSLLDVIAVWNFVFKAHISKQLSFLKQRRCDISNDWHPDNLGNIDKRNIS